MLFGPGSSFGSGSLSTAPELPWQCRGAILGSSLSNSLPVMGLSIIYSPDLRDGPL